MKESHLSIHRKPCEHKVNITSFCANVINAIHMDVYTGWFWRERIVTGMVVSKRAILKQFYFILTKLSQKCINSSTQVLL